MACLSKLMGLATETTVCQELGVIEAMQAVQHLATIVTVWASARLPWP